MPYVDADSHGVPAVAIAQNNKVLSATPVLDTLIYASGDTMHATVMTFAGAVLGNGRTGLITGLNIIDKDAQGVAGELWLFSTAVTLPAANAAWSISDADAANCIGVIAIASTNYFASALNKIGTVLVAGLPFQAAAADTAIYGALVTRGTPTHTASGLVVNLMLGAD